MSAFGWWIAPDVEFAEEDGFELMLLLDDAGRRREDLVPQEHYLAFGAGDIVLLLLDVDGRYPGRVILLIYADWDFYASGRSLVDWARWRTALAEAGRVRRLGTDGVTVTEGLPRDEKLEELAARLDIDPAGFRNN